MALATLYNVPSSDNELNVFSFSNQNEHTKIAANILKTFGVVVPSYVLDPIPINDMGVWLQQHQNLHNIMSGVVGSNANDLTDVNFRDKDQLSQWIWLHAQEHYQVAATLKLQ